MPPVAAAVTAAASFLAGTAFTIGTVAVSWGTVLMTTTSLASSLVAMSSKPSGAVAEPGRNIGIGVDAFMPRKCVYGRAATSGDRIFADTYSNNQKLGQVLALSIGMISGVTSTVLNETTVSIDGSDVVQTAPWAGNMRLQFKDGTDGKTAHSTLVSGSPHWTSAHRGRGVSDVFWETTYDQDSLAGGIPVPMFIGDYAIVYDPRKDSTNGGSGTHRTDDPTTWEFSRSGPLQALHYILGLYQNGKRVWGLGVPTDLIDFDSFAAAADICEVNVGGTPRFTTGGVVAADDNPREVLEAFGASFGGAIFPSGGLIKCIAAGPITASITLTDDDLDGGVEYIGNQSFRDAVNTVRVKFTDPDRDYRANTTAGITDSAYITEDNGEILDEEFPALMSDNEGCAHRLGRLRLANKREPRTIRARWKAKAFRLVEGSTVNIASTRLGVTEKMIVLERSLQPSGTVQLTLRTETDAKYTAMDAFTQAMPTFARVDRYDPTSVSTPSGGDWTVTAVELDNGNAKLPVVRVAGGTDDPLVRAALVEYRVAGSGTWQRWEETTNVTAVQVDIAGLTPGTEYETRIRYRNVSGVLGDPLEPANVTTSANLVSTDATAPSAAISDAVTAINTAQGRADSTLAEAGQALAEAAETSLQDSLLNWIEDPTGSDGWLAADGGFIIGKTSGFKALWTPLASGAQTTKVLWFPAEKNVAPGVLVQAGVEIAVEGAVSSVALEAVWFDSAGSVLSTDELDSGATGRLSGVEAAPASAASVRFRLVPTASSAADGVVAVSEPLTAFGRPDQVTADGYQDPTSEVVSRFVSIERSLGSMAGSVRQALTENRRARASITTTMATQVGQDSAIAALETSLLATVAGTYLTQATAASTYSTIAYTDGAVSTAQTTLQANIDTVSASVTTNAGAIADIEGAAAYFSLAVAAGGGNPAIYEMYSGKDGSAITLGGDAIYMFTTVGGTSVKTLELVSGDIYTANDVYVGNDLIVATSGAIMGGATGYLTGTGFFLGYDSAAYKLAVGNPSGQHLAWDGSTLAITGDITRAFGTSGALTIGDLGGGRTGFEILNSAGVEAFYADDTGAMRLNGDALPTTRAATAPSTPSPGHRWWDTVNEVESRWNGSTWDTWGSYGATWGDNVASIPTNLAALVGSEGILNTAVAIGADGALTGGGGGQVTISGLGYVGDLDATAGATWGNNVASIPTNLSTLVGSEGILNTAVSIAANGTLSGAGGGQVTLSGVGFTGDTNATYGAAWGSTVTGRPTELTDGRVAAGLDALGDLNRNISSARLDSSNALRRTGGGLFSGALNANYITNTNELTDGASLGTTAAWASISSRPAELTDGRITSALNASGILQTPIQNASQIPTLTLSKVSDAGTLAAKSTVAQAEISSGYSLIESGAGTPTATSRRIYEDTTNDVIWYDDGTDIRRISREALTDNLGSNTGFSGAAYKVVVAIEVPGLKELDLLSIQTLQSNFQGPNEATNENVVGEWAIGIVDASRAPGDAWAGTGTENIIADGRTINFQLDGSDVVVNGNGIEGLILDVGGYRIPVAYEGTCYLCLLLRLTSFTSDQILLAGTGTQMRILISP